MTSLTNSYSWPEGKTANECWRETVKRLLQVEATVSPRGKPIKEILANKTVVNMHYPVLTNMGRKLGYKFMAAEASWILSGDNRVSTIAPYSKAISSFSDDGEFFFGAYGPKIQDQIDYVCRKLVEDNDTRQAVINIWREKPPITKDVPCTLSLQFIYRAHQLHCVATMRSSDIWLGWPYDVFNFTMLTTKVLLELRMRNDLFQYGDVGNLHLTAGSQHLYMTNEAAAFDAALGNDSMNERLDVNAFGGPSHLDEFLFYAKDKRLEEWRTKRKSKIRFLSELLS
jgi:thymidylate synthase